MREDAPVAALIDRIVASARIPSRAAREDLRRELVAHFEDAGASADSLDDAIRRFGPEAQVTASWRRVYRREYALLYVAKIAASVIASAIAALAIEALVNLRVEVAAEAWRLAPGFSYAAVVALAIVFGLTAAWEAGRPPLTWPRCVIAFLAYAGVLAVVEMLFERSAGAFLTATLLVAIGWSCSRRRASFGRLVLTFAAFAAAEYAIHLARNVTFGASRAVAAGAVLTIVWGCTVVILARFDRVFLRVFDLSRPRAA